MSQPIIFSLYTRDLDEATERFSQAYTPVRIQQGTAPNFDVLTNAVMFDDVSFSSSASKSGIEIYFSDPFDGYGLTLPESGNFELRQGPLQELTSSRDGGLMVDSKAVRSVKLLPGTLYQRISVSSQAMHTRLSALMDGSARGRIRFRPEVALSSTCGLTARTICSAIRSGIEGDARLLQSPASMGSLREAVMNLLLETIPHSFSENLSAFVSAPSPRHIKQAMDFMRANVQASIRLEDIAAASGVTPRTLQLGFRSIRGMTPMAFLRKIRLEGARRDLASGSAATVAAAAYAWGFSHPSVFSTNYLREFGESPSATLRYSASNRSKKR